MNKQKIGIYCTIEKTNIKPQKGTIYNVYSLPAFDNNKTTEYTDGENIKSNKFKVFPHSILFNKLNVRFKRVWNIDEYVEENGICSTEYLPIKVISDELDKDYLFYNLISDDFTNSINASRKGTSNSHQRIDIENVFEYEIIVPNIEEQKKIASIFRTIDKKIEVNKAINRNLHNQINALYSGKFEQYIISNNLPVGWQLVKIGDIAEVKNGFAFKGTDFVEDGTVPVIKIKNVKPYKILLNTIDYVKEETIIGKDRFKIKHGDILITLTGNRKDGSPDSWVGKVAVFDVFGDYYLNQRLGIIEPDTSKVSTYYLSEFLSSWAMQKYFIERATSSGGQANISPDLIKKIEFTIPSKSEMDEFDNLVSSYYKAIAKLQDEMNKLEILRDTILPKLMSGDVDVSELNL